MAVLTPCASFPAELNAAMRRPGWQATQNISGGVTLQYRRGAAGAAPHVVSHNGSWYAQNDRPSRTWRNYGDAPYYRLFPFTWPELEAAQRWVEETSLGQ